jgi:hypothetical protein
MHPTLCRVVVERQQRVAISAQAVYGLGVLGLEAPKLAIEGAVRCLAGLGHGDLMQFRLALGL